MAAQIAAPPTPPIAAPRDIPYPGTIVLKVDATDLTHGIFTVHETLPLDGSGPVTLLYPKWLPGNHSPTGPIDKLAGLIITANGQRIPWRRDPVEITAFHVDPPAGATSLELSFQYLSAVSSKEGHVDMTPVMLALNWNAVVLYPAGHYARNIVVQPSIVLPTGFTAATALEPAGAPGAYKAVTLNTLVDSPLMAGRYFKVYDLDTSGKSPIRLDVMADLPFELDAKPAEIAAHRDLVVQADRLFGSRHFAHYDFLLWLSDKLGGAGLEHHQSSEDGTSARPISSTGTASPPGRDLLAHEYTHSWNGKFRRPADLWTPNFEVPMRGSLLWVYEGQTQYWGYVLSARSGLMSRKDTLDAIALTAATYDQRVGRVVAAARGHHQRSDDRRTPSAVLAELAAQRGLLFRGPDDLARRRHPDPGAVRRQAFPRRLRPALLRRRRRVDDDRRPTPSTTSSRR